MSVAASQLWRTLSLERPPPRVPRGLDAAWAWTLGQLPRLSRRRPGLERRAAAVLALEPEFVRLSEGELHAEALRLRERFRRGRDTPADLDRSFALIRQVASRALGERPHPVQVVAALAIHSGCIAELATGEGKTLASTLPIVIAGWRGRGCHVITANDYLAARDAQWMAPVYRACGVSAASVIGPTSAPDRAAAYRADVTYTTAKEAAADFLRDRLTLGSRGRASDLILESLGAGHRGAASPTTGLLQRGLVHAVIDEADAILIDDAVTPLILSVAMAAPHEALEYQEAAALAASLTERTDFSLDHADRSVRLTRAGRTRLQHALKAGGPGPRRREELLVQALEARHFFRRGREFIVRENKVLIVDEATGRLTPDRSWRDGMHQAIEAAEGLPITAARTTAARISFQRFFRLYHRLSGMSGTAREAAGELWRVYRLPVVRIPTHAPGRRLELPDRVFRDSGSKLAAVADEARVFHAADRPILLGTRSVRASIELSERLSRSELPHEVLNAEREAEEARIIALAGNPGRITVATNMAGRGTDIRLGPGVSEAGGLHVMLTERHASRRLDRQLRGRAGRQGDPGSARALVGLDDELVTRHAPRLGSLLGRLTSGAESELRGWRLAAASLLWWHCERRATRLAARRRAAVLASDDWLDDLLGFGGPSA